MSTVPELYYEKVESVGTVKRIYFHFRAVVDGVSTWHYYGVDPADKPPMTADPVVEHQYVQFPRDLDDLPQDEADEALYDLALMVARKEI